MEELVEITYWTMATAPLPSLPQPEVKAVSLRCLHNLQGSLKDVPSPSGIYCMHKLCLKSCKFLGPHEPPSKRTCLRLSKTASWHMYNTMNLSYPFRAPGQHRARAKPSWASLLEYLERTKPLLLFDQRVASKDTHSMHRKIPLSGRGYLWQARLWAQAGYAAGIILSEYDGDFTDLSYYRRMVLLQNLKKLKRHILGYIYMTVLVGSEFPGSRQGTFCSRVSLHIQSWHQTPKPLVSASWVLGYQVSITTPNFWVLNMCIRDNPELHNNKKHYS